jgi:hypothetical protein
VCDLRRHERLLLIAAFRRAAPWVFLGVACVGELLTVRIEQEGSTLIEGGGVLGDYSHITYTLPIRASGWQFARRGDENALESAGDCGIFRIFIQTHRHELHRIYNM